MEFRIKIEQKYSARHLSPSHAYVARRRSRVLARQLAALKNVNRPEAETAQGATFMRSMTGEKLSAI